jgi:hypothetical protein
MVIWGQTSLATAITLGEDRNGNGIWDDLDVVCSQVPVSSQLAAQKLARDLQDFTLSPPGNQSLALESMRKAQEGLLCLYATSGQQGAQIAKTMQDYLMANPERRRRFLTNQALIQGQEIPFEPDPQKWSQYCPFSVNTQPGTF